ncbi:hypothetical protein EV121DRAFT_264740, partial [Schizophyllum commune]
MIPSECLRALCGLFVGLYAPKFQSHPHSDCPWATADGLRRPLLVLPNEDKTSSSATRRANLDLQIASIKDQLAALVIYRNSLADISSLPNEILGDIFLLYARDTNTLSGLRWTKLLLVCRRWTIIGLSTPALWSYIEFDNYALAASVLAQEKRINLRTLSLSLHGLPGEVFVVPGAHTEHIVCSLRILRLSNVSLDWSYLRNLSSITIINNSALLEVLRYSPRLEDMFLNDCLTLSDTHERSAATLWGRTSSYTALISRLHFPRVRRVILEAYGPFVTHLHPLYRLSETRPLRLLQFYNSQQRVTFTWFSVTVVPDCHGPFLGGNVIPLKFTVYPRREPALRRIMAAAHVEVLDIRESFNKEIWQTTRWSSLMLCIRVPMGVDRNLCAYFSKMPSQLASQMPESTSRNFVLKMWRKGYHGGPYELSSFIRNLRFGLRTAAEPRATRGGRSNRLERRAHISMLELRRWSRLS